MLLPFPSCWPPPHLRPSTITPGLACPVFVLQVEEGGVQREAVDPPFLESPGAERKLGRRWGGGPLISKHQHLEINIKQSTLEYVHARSPNR